MEYYFKKKLNLKFNDAVEKVKEGLSIEGFGILNQIDVSSTLKKKLDIDFESYIILGACNPKLAHLALSEEIDIGLLLPCNVIIYLKDLEVYVSAINPNVAMNFIDNENLKSTMDKVSNKLKKVILNL